MNQHNYTAEQVEHVAEHFDGQPGEFSYEIATIIRAYAATLRQQAGAVAATDAEIAEWAERHDLNFGGSATAAREAFEDAESHHRTRSALARPASSEPASGEAVKLAAILDGMTEGSYNLETLYEIDQPDGDPFVRRAADLLREFARTNHTEPENGEAVGVGFAADAVNYSRNFARSNPELSRTTIEHIEGLCSIVERLSAAKLPEGMVLVPREPTEAMVEAGRSAVMARDCSGPNWGPADHYRTAGISREGIPDSLFEGKGKMDKAWGAELVYAAMLAAAPGADGEAS